MNILKISVAVVAALAVAGLAAPRPAEAGVSFGFFWSNLSPHGSWHVSASYGQVWQPYGYHAGWHPYHDGRWMYTDAGWYWDSYQPWGAVPYHYGTWAYDPYYGWVWVPGYTWAPSWVAWRTAPGYIGWAPVPVGFSIGVSIGGGHHHDHWDDWDDDHYVYVGDHDFMCDNVARRVVPVERTRAFVTNTTSIRNNYRIVNGVVHNDGPQVEAVRRATRQSVRPVPVESTRAVRALGRARPARELIGVDPQRVAHGIRAAEPELRREAAQVRPQRNGGGTARASRTAGGSQVRESADARRESALSGSTGRGHASQRPTQVPAAAAPAGRQRDRQSAGSRAPLASSGARAGGERIQATSISGRGPEARSARTEAPRGNGDGRSGQAAGPAAPMRRLFDGVRGGEARGQTRSEVRGDRRPEPRVAAPAHGRPATAGGPGAHSAFTRRGAAPPGSDARAAEHRSQPRGETARAGGRRRAEGVRASDRSGRLH